MSSSRSSYCETHPISVQFDNIDRLDVMVSDEYGLWLVTGINHNDDMGQGNSLSVTRLDGEGAGGTGKINDCTLSNWKRLHNLLDLYSDLS